MRKILFGTLLLAVTTYSFAQQTISSSATVQTDYLKKSKQPSTTAWVLLGAGLAINLAGALFSTQLSINGSDAGSLFDDKTSKAGSVMGAIGFCSMLTSIPFFIAAHRNKKKYASLSFQNGSIPKLQQGSFASRPLPSVTFKINL